MIARKYKSRRLRVPAISLVPPDLQKIGDVEFTAVDRKALSAWLNEEDWPRKRMNADMIEGYLVALIVWPVDISPGAWLPPIWGTDGWKVPAKIDSASTYDRFIRLIIGYRQHLDRTLNTDPSSFVLGMSEPDSGSDRSTAGMGWAQGFLIALQQGSQGLQWRSDAARSAVSLIANYAHPQADPESPTAAACAAEMRTAALALVAERTFRGPKDSLHPRDSGRRGPRPAPLSPAGLSPAGMSTRFPGHRD